MDQCAAHLIPALHRAAADCVDLHNAILEVVRLLAHLPRQLCLLPMSGDSSEMPPAFSFEWTVSARVLRERIAPQPGRAELSCPAMTERMRESLSSVAAKPHGGIAVCCEGLAHLSLPITILVIFIHQGGKVSTSLRFTFFSLCGITFAMLCQMWCGMLNGC